MLGALSVLQLVLKHRGDLRPARPRRLDTDDFAIVVANARESAEPAWHRSRLKVWRVFDSEAEALRLQRGSLDGR